jgi:hypothetical protein
MSEMKRTIRDYKKFKGGEVYESDVDYFPKEIKEMISFFQGLLDEGFTHLDPQVYTSYDCPFAKISYYRIREETDEEFATRMNVAREREESERRRKETIASLTSEQREALGISDYMA